MATVSGHKTAPRVQKLGEIESAASGALSALLPTSPATSSSIKLPDALAQAPSRLPDIEIRNRDYPDRGMKVNAKENPKLYSLLARASELGLEVVHAVSAKSNDIFHFQRNGAKVGEVTISVLDPAKNEKFAAALQSHVRKLYEEQNPVFLIGPGVDLAHLKRLGISIESKSSGRVSLPIHVERFKKENGEQVEANLRSDGETNYLWLSKLGDNYTLVVANKTNGTSHTEQSFLIDGKTGVMTYGATRDARDNAIRIGEPGKEYRIEPKSTELFNAYRQASLLGYQLQYLDAGKGVTFNLISPKGTRLRTHEANGLSVGGPELESALLTMIRDGIAEHAETSK